MTWHHRVCCCDGIPSEFCAVCVECEDGNHAPRALNHYLQWWHPPIETIHTLTISGLPLVYWPEFGPCSWGNENANALPSDFITFTTLLGGGDLIEHPISDSPAQSGGYCLCELQPDPDPPFLRSEWTVRMIVGIAGSGPVFNSPARWAQQAYTTDICPPGNGYEVDVYGPPPLVLGFPLTILAESPPTIEYA